MDRFTSLKNTAPVVQALKNRDPAVPRSRVDYSNNQYFTLSEGLYAPVDLIDVLPNEDITISYDMLLRSRNPLVRDLLCGKRLIVECYYQKKAHLWKGWNTFIDSGYSRSVNNLTIPTVAFTFTKDGKTYSTLTPQSLGDFLGLPIHCFDKNGSILNSFKPCEVKLDTIVNPLVKGVSALPFMFYQQLFKDFKCNSILTRNNRSIYFDEEDKFCLDYSYVDTSKNSDGEIFTYFNLSSSDWNILFSDNFDVNSYPYVPHSPTSLVLNNIPLPLTTIHYHQKRGDSFTSANPFPDLMAGDAPSVDISSLIDIVTTVDSSIMANVANNTEGANVTADLKAVGWYDGANPTSLLFENNILKEGQPVNTFQAQQLLSRLYTVSSTANSKVTTGLLNFTANTIRNLMTASLISEKLALTDGSYNDFIKSHFGVDPNSESYKPIFIGSFYQDITFNTNIQTSASTSDSPLGTKNSNANMLGNGFIGKFHVPDHGYIMTCVSVIPDNIYTQGLDRHWFKLTQDEQYLPLKNNLPPQALLNKEILFSGDPNVDDDVFGYTERFEEYKSRRNRAHGLISLKGEDSNGQPWASYDSALISSYHFDSTPNLNNQFVTLCPANIDMSIYSVPSEPPFELVSISHIDRVGPYPYATTPSDLGLKYN